MSGRNIPKLFAPAEASTLSRAVRFANHNFRPLKFTFSTALLFSLLWNLALLEFFHYSYRLESHLSRTPPAAVKRVREKIIKALQGRSDLNHLLQIPDREKLADILARGFHGSGLETQAQIEALMRLLDTLTEQGSENDPSASGDGVSLDKLLESLLRQGVIELKSGDIFFTAPSGKEENPLAFHALPKDKRERIKALRRFEDREKMHANVYGDSVRIKTAAGIKYIPLEYYFRDSPYEQILAEGAAMFYIIQGFPDIEPADLPPIDLPPIGSGRFDLVLIRDLIPAQKEYPLPVNRSVFQATEERIREILDGLMHFPENQQLSFFAERYLDSFDPDQGDLPYLTRELIRNNLCSIVINYNSLSGAFGFIEQLFFSRPLDLTFHGYNLAHPETRTGTEFLFALASHYNFEKRAVQYLYKAYPEARMVLMQSFPESDIFNKKLKAYIIKEIYGDLTAELRRSGYSTLEDVLAKYSFEEKKIYEHIIASGETDKNRGLYALGSLYWKDKIYDQAVEEWSRIDRSFTFETFIRIKSVLAQSTSQSQKIAQIDGILEWDAQKGSEDLLERLLKYQRWEKRARQIHSTV